MVFLFFICQVYGASTTQNFNALYVPCKELVFEGIWLTLLGSVASALVSASFIPQIIKGYKTKHLADVSYLLMIMISIGMSLWIVYGIEKQDLVIIGANITTIALNMILLGLKVRYTRSR
jgi:MtN3 and saliva related transmembrane protein